MWPFKRKTKPEEQVAHVYAWMAPGGDNPFDAPIMDIRSFTQTVLATSSDPDVAASFLHLRGSDGKEYIDTQPENYITLQADFSLPHNSEPIEGIVFKSSEMEEKWDIYAYGEWIYFVRSWSGALTFKVRYTMTEDALIFSELLAAESFTDNAAELVFVILKTHALGQPWPVYVPDFLRELDGQTLAQIAFGHLGVKATLLTCTDPRALHLVLPPS